MCVIMSLCLKFFCCCFFVVGFFWFFLLQNFEPFMDQSKHVEKMQVPLRIWLMETKCNGSIRKRKRDSISAYIFMVFFKHFFNVSKKGWHFLVWTRASHVNASVNNMCVHLCVWTKCVHKIFWAFMGGRFSSKQGLRSILFSTDAYILLSLAQYLDHNDSEEPNYMTYILQEVTWCNGHSIWWLEAT